MANTPVIVIVPGAFHQPAHYDQITTPLRERGYQVITPFLATTGEGELNRAYDHIDDQQAIHDLLLPLLDKGRRKAVMVSHSYGSLPAATAVQGLTTAERRARGLNGGIEAIVTISGFAFPARGKSIMNDDSEMDPQPYHIISNGIVHLQDTAKQVFYSDLTDQEADAAWALAFRQQTRKSFCTFPNYITSEIKVPKTYILCENDQALPPPFQEMMAQIGLYDEVVRIPSGHSPFINMPERVVNIIAQVAEKV